MDSSSKVKSISGPLNYILFFVWPFAALVFASINYKSKVSRNILWLFCAFFGFTFVISSDGIDAAFYRDKFVTAYNDTSIEFISYVFNEGSTDFFINFLNFTLSRFTNDHRVLFLSFGFLFGYFYSRNIFLLLDFSSKSLNRFTWLPLILFVFLVPFWNINGIRFYLATHIFVYGTLLYIINGKKRFLLITLLAPLVHFSFTISLSLLSVYVIIGNRFWVYFLLLSIAMFVYHPDLATILNYIPELSGTAQDKLEGYTFHEYVEYQMESAANSSWFVFLRFDLLNYFFYLICLYFVLFKYGRLKESKYSALLLIGVLFLTLGKFAEEIPSTERFIGVSYLYFSAFLYLELTQHRVEYWLKRIMFLSVFPFFLFIAVEFRIGLDMISPGIFYTNPLVAPFIEYKTPLSKYYK